MLALLHRAEASVLNKSRLGAVNMQVEVCVLGQAGYFSPLGLASHQQLFDATLRRAGESQRCSTHRIRNHFLSFFTSRWLPHRLPNLNAVCLSLATGGTNGS